MKKKATARRRERQRKCSMRARSDVVIIGVVGIELEHAEYVNATDRVLSTSQQQKSIHTIHARLSVSMDSVSGLLLKYVY